MSLATRFASAAASAILSAALLLNAAAAKDWTTVRIAMDATYPPFESLDPSGQIVGFDKDIADALCERMKVKCEFANQAWDGIIPGLLANKYDAILSSMSITEERKQQIDFSDKIYNTPPAIAVPKDSTLKGVTPEDLAGITIGAQTSTTHANYAQEKFPEAELKIYPSPDEYKLDLANGRLDAAIDDVVVLDRLGEERRGRLLQDPRRARRRIPSSTVPAPASASARRTPTCATCSTRRSPRSAPTAPTRRSTTSISRSTSTAAERRPSRISREDGGPPPA